MQKHWEGSVHIDAPVAEVFTYLTDFNRHPEWDGFAEKVEQIHGGTASGVGAEWKVWERLDLFSQGKRGTRFKDGLGLAKRQVRHVELNQRIVWHTHPTPPVGISADFTFEVAPDGTGTRVTQHVQVNVPGVVHSVGRLVAKNLDEKQEAQWQANLDNLKQVVEGAAVREPVAV